MVQSDKWKTVPFFIPLFIAISNSLPIDRTLLKSNLASEINIVADSAFTGLNNNELKHDVVEGKTEYGDRNTKNTYAAGNSNIRAGMTVTRHSVTLTINNDGFTGRSVLDVTVTDATRNDRIMFHAADLNIGSVKVGLISETNAENAPFTRPNGNVLDINPPTKSNTYVVIVEYSGNIRNDGKGLYRGGSGDSTYLAMNLHPTNARRVFPCIDEPTEASMITFSINGLDYDHLVSNSRLEDNSLTQFRPMGGPAHVWGMMAHNFVNINIPIANVLLFGRGVTNQDTRASGAIHAFFTSLNEWTGKDYFQIVENVQDGRMHVVALPDVSSEWHSLSVVGVWEPYIFMEAQHSIQQWKSSMVNIAEAMARQWFGYVIYPANWIHEWVVSGLGTYAAYEALRSFQTNPNAVDESLLDIDAMFVTDVIQESLLRDAHASALILEPDNRVFNENQIRDRINGLVKYKAPAIMSMLRVVLGNQDNDFIHIAAQGLFISRSLQTVTTLNFIDAINSQWLSQPNRLIDNIEAYLKPFLKNTGYPVVHVGLRPGGVLLTQERFGFSAQPAVTYSVPITYTTGANPNFENIYPAKMLVQTMTENVDLGADDWIIFNLQGRGYYRVNYDPELWERIIDALNDPDERGAIHKINRASLIDDALNLARAGRLDYDLAFSVAMTIQHEIDYAPWKAFIRNMEFVRKRIAAAAIGNNAIDVNAYAIVLAKMLVAFEEEIGFMPEPNLSEPAMNTLTRGLVMGHACRANYDPCVAAAIDLFYDPNSSEPAVNPNIPRDLRPAVYCTMVRDGGDDIRSALLQHLESESTMYERVVILEALACSKDGNFINTYLQETIAANSPYSIEEKSRIFIAIAESNFANAQIAMDFISTQTNQIRNSYGGADKLEALLAVLAENLVNDASADAFLRWVSSVNSNLADSLDSAKRAHEVIKDNLEWNSNQMGEAYEWIVENDASTAALSMVLVLFTFALTFFNY